MVRIQHSELQGEKVEVDPLAGRLSEHHRGRQEMPADDLVEPASIGAVPVRGYPCRRRGLSGSTRPRMSRIRVREHATAEHPERHRGSADGLETVAGRGRFRFAVTAQALVAIYPVPGEDR